LTTAGIRGGAVLLGASIAIAACSGPSPSATSPSRTSVAPASTGPGPGSPAPNAASASPPPSVGLAASFPPIGVAADPGLLDLVPAAQAGAGLTYDAATTASVGADPSLAADISYLAIGLARPLGAAASDPDFAIVNVARPRDQVAITADWFRDWRDTYDAAACAQAGGVARRSETKVDTLTVFTAGCAGGAFTYHALIGDGGIVLSITSIGPGDLGRKIAEKLHR
jgi:hypothetical protein